MIVKSRNADLETIYEIHVINYERLRFYVSRNQGQMFTSLTSTFFNPLQGSQSVNHTVSVLDSGLDIDGRLGIREGGV